MNNYIGTPIINLCGCPPDLGILTTPQGGSRRQLNKASRWRSDLNSDAVRCAPGGLSESHAPSRRPVLLPLGGLSKVEVGAAAGNGETLLLMSPKRREQLGTGEGGHGSSCAPRLCCLPGWSSAGAGGWSWGWSWGPAMAPGGHSPGAAIFPTALSWFYSWALFSVTSHPLFPGPALPLGRPGAS